MMNHEATKATKIYEGTGATRIRPSSSFVCFVPSWFLIQAVN
jgi:hypothetical protein